MKIIYLGHSGFLAETENAYFIFDYIQGDLPALSEEKRLYLFVSHAHKDHWNSDLLTDKRFQNAAGIILGFDIKRPFEKMARTNSLLKDLPILWADAHPSIKTDDFICDTLLSTEEGVAFLVRTEKEVLYHAGDLNWWHWNGDPEERNLERADNFKCEVDRLKGIHIDVAFVPLDPRQEDAYRFCMDYCMETLDADHFFPMHFWGNYELCRQYQESLKETHPDRYRKFHLITFEGEQFLL